MSADGYVQVGPDSTGKKIDNSEITRDDGTIVERQRVVLSDDVTVGVAGKAEVRDRKVQVEDRTLHILEHIYETLQRIEFRLQALAND